jgi:sugar (pentulose or hexulose) kinase
MTRLSQTVEPDPRRHELYDQLYRRVYRRLYDRLQPLYEEIMAITGYPPS